MKNKENNSNAYIAHGENAFLICGYGNTYGSALKKVGKLIDTTVKKNPEILVLGLNSSYDESGEFCVTATLSTAGV
jgi:hypothetical protein